VTIHAPHELSLTSHPSRATPREPRSNERSERLPSPDVRQVDSNAVQVDDGAVHPRFQDLQTGVCVSQIDLCVLESDFSVL